MYATTRLHSALCWLEANVRKPMEGTLFDVYVARPAKKWYLHNMCKQI